jgi:hypothetical protein
VSPVLQTALRARTLAACLLAAAFTTILPAQQPIATVLDNFAHPPDDARIMMRWWWFGPAVVKPELEREILAMKAGGIGGFEIQPVYPMALNDETTGFHNLPYLSDGFLDAVTFANDTAHANGMRVDMTLASGWPYGGPHVAVDQAAARLRVVALDLPPAATSLPIPAMGNGESLIAIFAGPGTAAHYEAAKLHQIPPTIADGRLTTTGQPVVVFYIASRTGQQVKRAAVDAEGFVLDHFSLTAVDDHLKIVGDKLLAAFGDHPPYAVFSDSLEVYGADWTGDLLPEFQRRRGYDLTPYLPQLATGTGELTAELRHDWGQTLTELIDERYLTPIDRWATAHGTRFRSQTYGDPAVSLSSNRLVALPEGEGPQWNRFSYTRLATSASHLFGRPITSAETWTWLHSPAFRATPLDMKAEADRFFLEGVNQLIGHGWPYTPPGVAEPGWSFYAAAVFNHHNPWWIVMPDVTKYLQRVSYLLRQGKPANDVALFLPNDDAYTQFKPGTVSLSDVMPQYVTPEVTQQILGAGHNLDYIDAEAIQTLGVPYPVLILPHVQRLTPATLTAIAAYVKRGGKVIAVGSIPDRAPGFLHAETLSAEVQAAAKALFTGNPNTQFVAHEEDLGAALAKSIPTDLALTNNSTDIGFLHRILANADIYFLANTTNQPIQTVATVRTPRPHATTWNPFTGEAQIVSPANLTLNLAPYESRILVLSDESLPAAQASAQPTPTTLLEDLTANWTLSIPGQPDQLLAKPESWTTLPNLTFYSGTAVYRKTIHLTAAQLADAKSLSLDFGPGTPIPDPDPDSKAHSGMQALSDSPIREAAVVTVNGQRLGAIWCPPFTLDITSGLHPGDNLLELTVANTAINRLSGRAPADYRLLNQRYTERFTPQDMKGLAPIPSGILGPIHLLETK